MGKLIYVTGGARSGKSTFAERMASVYGDQVGYIATAICTDDEMRARIERHREQRNKNWTTYECWKDVSVHLAARMHRAYLLDCLTVMITNLMFDIIGMEEDPSGAQIESVQRTVDGQLEAIVRAVSENPIDLIVVSNEVGMGLVPPYPLGRIFRDIAGRANQYMALRADEAYLLVSGIPVKLK